MSNEILHSPDSATCACSACLGLLQNGGLDAVDASLDPLAGGTFNNKPIFSAEQVAAHLNRTGAAYTAKPTDAKQQGDTDITTINFGFFSTQAEMANNGYVYQSPTDGKFYGLAEYFNFAPFSDVQKAAAREAMQSWDDVVAVTFRETNIDDADITFGNLASAPTTQAYSRLPFDRIFTNAVVNEQSKWIAGDVWISASQQSNFRLDEGGYGLQTLTHEVGHSLGLSHPGAYNAAPGVSITYGPNAEYAKDTRGYSIMSYFEGSSISGTRHFDFHMSTTAYSGVPLIHDIAAVQKIYGADMTTRTGDTTYGFNSNAGRDSFDFTLTPAPIMAIWDAVGIDTLDASGYATDQVIDLAPGSMSNIGGVTFETAPSYEQVVANRLAAGITTTLSRATYDANMAALKANPAVGRLTNNVGIAYGATIENAIGGSGNDTIMGNSVDNILKGNAGNDIIGGGAGNDTLDGGTGDDTMLGGIGNDIFIVGEAGDVVTELVGEGTDTVRSSINYMLGDHLENLDLTGAALTGTGNGLDNIITGNALGNVLDGGAGNDTLRGGGGNDRYIVDAAGDVVVELAGEGIDTVVASINYTLGADVENLELTGAATKGTGNGLNNSITGNALGNVLDGGAGNDILRGGDGTDVFTGGAGNDRFVAELNTNTVASKQGNLSIDVILDFNKAGTDTIDFTALEQQLGFELNFAGKSSGNNKGDVTWKSFGNVNAAEAALGFDIDGIDGVSTATGPVTILFVNTDDDAAQEIGLVLFDTNKIEPADLFFG